MGTRILATGVTLLVAAGLLLLGWPQLFGLERTAPFAQLVSFRLGAVVGVFLIVTVLALVGVFVPVVRRLVLAIGATAMVFVLAVGSVQLVRGFGQIEAPEAHLGDIRVLSWNTEGGLPGADVIALTALNEGANVIALQETSPEDAAAVAGLLAPFGLAMTVFTASQPESTAAGTALLVSTALGEYSQDTAFDAAGRFPTVVVRPTDQSKPILVSAHAAPPVEGLTDAWSSDIDRISELCSLGDVVIAGDLNSTLDHWAAIAGEKTFGACSDAGLVAGAAAVGTWPSQLPSAFGAAIDHVVYSGDRDVSGYEVLDLSPENSSDHRPLVVQLSVARLYKGFDK